MQNKHFVHDRLLLEAGADIACVDNEGQLPIDKAEEDDMRQLLAGWMRKKGESYFP